jgi:hypothetical protein
MSGGDGASAPLLHPNPRHSAEFVQMLRARLETMPRPDGGYGITYKTFDAIAGWAEEFASKLLADPPIRQVGLHTLFVALQSVALTMRIEHDPAQYERIKNRLVKPRGSSRMLPGGKHERKLMEICPDFMRLISAMGNEARNQKLSRRRRKLIARRAALARHHPDQVEIKPKKKLHQGVFVKKR